MKLGILGTGMIVREFLPWLAGEDSPFTVQALCSTQRSAPAAAELCEQYHIPQHTTNYFELLQWVDVVYLAVPNNQHARYAKVALEAGKHVIVEKPMAVNALQAEELACLARRKKVFLFEAMTTQYLENYNKIRELLPRIGTVKLVQCNFSQYSSRYDAFCAGETLPIHEFHHWDSTANGTAFTACKNEKMQWECGFANENFYAGFPHLYWAGTPLPGRFVRAAERYSKTKG